MPRGHFGIELYITVPKISKKKLEKELELFVSVCNLYCAIKVNGELPYKVYPCLRG